MRLRCIRVAPVDSVLKVTRRFCESVSRAAAASGPQRPPGQFRPSFREPFSTIVARTPYGAVLWRSREVLVVPTSPGQALGSSPDVAIPGGIDVRSERS